MFVRRLILTIFALAVCCQRSSAAAAQGALPANHPLLETRLADFHLSGKSAADASSEIVSLTGAPGFDQALDVETQHRAANEYDVQLTLPLASAALHNGDIIWFSIWARMLHTADESGQGILGVVLERSKEPFDKLLQQRVSVGPQWQQFSFPARITSDYPAGSLHMSLRIGAAAQVLELAASQLIRFDDPASIRFADLPQTRITYAGRDESAAWRRDAEHRIESLREAPLTVRVTDAAGRPVEGAAIQVRMLRQAFAFGCVYNDGRLVGATAQSADSQAYQQHFLELFNTGVDEVAMKWPSWERPSSHQAALRSLQWMRDHHVAVRGHNIIWPGWSRLLPDLRALANDPAALKTRIDDHIRDITTALAGQVIEWDVVNEPYSNHDLLDVLGNGAMADWFKLAGKCDPAARLYVNETPVPTLPPRDQRYDTLYDRVRALQRQGAPIGGIGMESHFADALTSPTDLLAIYDRFATLGIPIRITELDIDVADERLQADYFRDFLIASFSHPEINGIVLWGFWEGQHWRPSAALFRKDWSIKPNGQVWKDLVLGKWWTNSHGTSSADGVYSTPGFLGDYEVTVAAGQRSCTVQISLPAKGANANVKLD